MFDFETMRADNRAGQEDFARLFEKAIQQAGEEDRRELERKVDQAAISAADAIRGAYSPEPSADYKRLLRKITGQF